MLTEKSDSLLKSELDLRWNQVEQQLKHTIQEINLVESELNTRKEFKLEHSQIQKSLSDFSNLVENLSLEDQVELFQALIKGIDVRPVSRSINEKHSLKYLIRTKPLKVIVKLNEFPGISLIYDNKVESSYLRKYGAPS